MDPNERGFRKIEDYPNSLMKVELDGSGEFQLLKIIRNKPNKFDALIRQEKKGLDHSDKALKLKNATKEENGMACYFFYEYEDPLEKILGSLNEKQTLDICLQVIDMFIYFAERNVNHCNLKLPCLTISSENVVHIHSFRQNSTSLRNQDSWALGKLIFDIYHKKFNIFLPKFDRETLNKYLRFFINSETFHLGYREVIGGLMKWDKNQRIQLTEARDIIKQMISEQEIVPQQVYEPIKEKLTFIRSPKFTRNKMIEENIALPCGCSIAIKELEERLLAKLTENGEIDLHCEKGNQIIPLAILENVEIENDFYSQRLSLKLLERSRVYCPRCHEFVSESILAGGIPKNVNCRDCQLRFCSYCGMEHENQCKHFSRLFHLNP